MTRSVSNFYSTDETGAIIPLAEISVNFAGGAEAPIYTVNSGGTPVVQPLIATASGKTTFYIEPGVYDIESKDPTTLTTSAFSNEEIGTSRADLSNDTDIDYEFATTEDLINNTFDTPPELGSIANSKGYGGKGDGGKGNWKCIENTGAGTPSQSPAQLGGALLNDGNGNQWGLVYSYSLNLSELGFDIITPTERTALIQGLEDSLSLLPFGANLLSPAGSFEFTGSTLVEAWPNASAGTVSASSCCLVHRERVVITGKGRDKTSWFCSNAALTLMLIDNGTNSSIKDIELSGGYTGVEAGAGHGIFNVVKDLGDSITNLIIDSVRIKNVASYGIGMNYGYQAKCSLQDIEIETTGADGIDIKSRSTGLEVNITNTINKLRCKNFGLRLAGQTGLDVRGEYSINDCWITDFGDGANISVGFRLRPVSSANNIAINTVATNIHVKANTNVSTTGIQVSGKSNKVIGFSVADCGTGVDSQESENCSISSGTISGHKINALLTTVSAINFGAFNVRAINADTATDHFRIEGAGFCGRGVSGDSTATDWSVSTAAALTISRDTPNNNENDGIDTREITAGRVGIQAQGPSTNIDIALSTKGSGLVRMGSHSLIAAESISGYINIKDSSGVIRKLAVLT